MSLITLFDHVVLCVLSVCFMSLITLFDHVVLCVLSVLVMWFFVFYDWFFVWSFLVFKPLVTVS